MLIVAYCYLTVQLFILSYLFSYGRSSIILGAVRYEALLSYFLLSFFLSFFFSAPNLRGRSVDRHQIFHMFDGDPNL